MATTSSSGGCKGYWQTVQLKYKDGLVIQATLDSPTIQKLESGDNVLMEEIRKNVMASADKGKQDASDNSDTEASKEEQTYTYWPQEAVKLLMFLYKEYESEMENPAKKKKDVWQVITKKLNEAGIPLTQNRVECKWRNLLQSHKNIRDNKKKSGEKRKSFQYFKEIEDIVGKRHDISPPCTSGSLIDNGQKRKFKTHMPNVKAVDLCDSVEDSSLTSIDQMQKLQTQVSLVPKEATRNRKVLNDKEKCPLIMIRFLSF